MFSISSAARPSRSANTRARNDVVVPNPITRTPPGPAAVSGAPDAVRRPIASRSRPVETA
jgi:hypothetical protein